MEHASIERVLRLIRLMGGNINYTIDELAEKLHTSERTVYRYIDTLKEAGFVVQKVRGAYYRIMRIPNTFKDLEKLIYFSEEEARVLTALINGLHESNVLKGNLYRKLSGIYEMTDIAKYHDNKKAALNVKLLGEAITDRKQVILKNYESSHSGTVRDRFVEPFDFTGEYVSVWAYDLEAEENKLFKVTRIDDVIELDSDWVKESLHRKGYLDVFRMQSMEQIPVKISMTLRAKNLLLEEFPMAMEDLHEENGHWILDTKVSRLEGVGRFVIGLAADVRIIDSPALEEYVYGYINDHLINLKQYGSGRTYHRE